jgi:large subunit ribosomal protein L29
MAMANKTDYASKSADELTKGETELRKQLFDLRFQHATRRLANPMELRAQKKELARLLTAKNAKG